MEKKRFINLYQEHAESIYRFCLFKARTKEDAEDVVSHVFEKLYEQEKIDHPKAWLYKSARNKMYDLYGSKQVSSQENWDDDVQMNEVAINQKELEEAVISDLLIEKVQTVLQTLDRDSVDIVTMRVWDDMSFAEIGEVLEQKEGTVRQKFHRAVAVLKSEVEGEKRQLKLRSVGLPMLLASIYGVGKAYASPLPTVFTQNLFNTLSITTNNMDAITQTSTENAEATTATGAKGAGMTSGFKLFLTVFITAIVVGGGVAGFFLLTDDSEDAKDEDEMVEEVENEEATSEEEQDSNEEIESEETTSNQDDGPSGEMIPDGWTEFVNTNGFSFYYDPTTFTVNSAYPALPNAVDSTGVSVVETGNQPEMRIEMTKFVSSGQVDSFESFATALFDLNSGAATTSSVVSPLEQAEFKGISGYSFRISGYGMETGNIATAFLDSDGSPIVTDIQFYLVPFNNEYFVIAYDTNDANQVEMVRLLELN